MALGYCPALLLSLDGLSTPNAASEKIGNIGALYAMLDPQNTGVFPGIDEGNGHYKSDGTDAARYAGVDTFGKPIVNIKHYVPNQATVQSVIDCASNGTPVNAETQFTLQFFKQKTFSLDLARLAALCAEASSVVKIGQGNSIERINLNTSLMNEVAGIMQGEMRGLAAAMNADVWTRLVAGIGVNAAQGDALTRVVDLINADGSANYVGFNTLLTDQMINEVSGKPIIIGGTMFNSFAMLQKWSCCSQSGIDWNAAFAANPLMPYFDPTADTALGAGQFLMIAPGSVKFASHNKNKLPALFGKKFDNKYFGTFVDKRIPGLEFNIEVAENACPHPVLDVTISLHYDVWVKPAIFGAGDTLTGNRGVYRYTAT